MMSKNIVDLYSNYDRDHHSIGTLVARSLPHQFSRQSHRCRQQILTRKSGLTRKWNRLPLLSCPFYFPQVNKQPLGLACGCNKYPTLGSLRGWACQGWWGGGRHWAGHPRQWLDGGSVKGKIQCLAGRFLTSFTSVKSSQWTMIPMIWAV